MAKVSKSPHRAFQANITVARGFVELHFIIEDLLERGGKKTIGKMMQFNQRVMKVAGISMQKLEKQIAEQLVDEVTERVERIGEEEMERRAKEAAEEMIPELEKIFERVKPVAAAYERGLLEQALVATVSALETYLCDVTMEAVGKNKYLRAAFTSKLQERLRYSDLVGTHDDVALAVGEVVANSYKFHDIQSVRKHLEALLRGPTPLDSKVAQRWFVDLQAHRNLIAHNAGVVDKRFRQRTGYKGKVGTPLRLRRKSVGVYIDTAEEFVASIQGQIEGLRA